MPQPNDALPETLASRPGTVAGEYLRRLWEEGQRPDFATLIAACSQLTPNEIAAAIDVDLWQRWQFGDRVQAEKYLEAFPTLRGDSEFAMQVVYGEFLLREHLGEKPQTDEYIRRFPAFADRLRQQVSLHQAIGGGQERVPPPAEPAAQGGTPGFSKLATGLRGSGLAETLPASSLPASTVPSAWPRIPGYEILGELGKGGMGIVYQARQQGLNRLVALKMIRGSANDEHWQARFQAEAQAVARLHHPNIVQVYEIGAQDGLPFFSLEYVNGGSLDKRLARQLQPAKPSAELVETLARAIHHAHGQGIVHRDLKPANILIKTAEQTENTEKDSKVWLSSVSSLSSVVKITDFGLAKQMDSAVHLTQTGTVMGTPAYMAPEQVRADLPSIGPATDIYALGAILYEMLTGRPPFVGPTPMQVLPQVTDTDPVPPSRLVAGVPRDLETICLKCLRKESAKRYADAEALADDLRRFRTDEPIQARPIGAVERAIKWARRRPAAAALVLVCTLATIGLIAILAGSNYLLAEKQRETNEALDALTMQERKTNDAWQAERRTSYLQRIAQIEIDWQANRIAKVRKLLEASPPDLRGWEWHYLQRRLTAGQRVWNFGAPQVGAVAFSPDGKLIAVGGGYDDDLKKPADVKVWDAATGQLRCTLQGHHGLVSNLAFQPGGKLLVSASERVDKKKVRQGQLAEARNVDGEVILWDLEKQTALATFPDSYGSVAFSPDGSVLAIAGRGGYVRLASFIEGKGWVIAEHEAGPAGAAVVAPPAALDIIKSLAFSHDGKWLATASTALPDLEKGLATYRAEVSLWATATGRRERTLKVSIGEVQQLVFSPNSKRLASANSASATVWDLDADKPPLEIAGWGNQISSVDFSPDGQRLAVGGKDQAVSIRDTATGKELMALHGHTAKVRCLAFDPSGPEPGRWLVSGGDDGVVRVWDTEEGQGGTTLSGLPMSVRHVTISPDGRRLAACAMGRVKIWDLATGASLAELDAHAVRSAFSPDGERIVTVGGALVDHTQPGQVAVWDAATGRKLQSLPGHTLLGNVAAWSPDGQRIITGCANFGRDPVKAGDLRIWDAQTYQELRSFRPVSRDAGRGAKSGDLIIMDAAYSPDSRTVVLVGVHDTAFLCDAETGDCIRAYQGHQAGVLSAAISRDGRLLATGGGTGDLIIRELATGTILHKLHNHSGVLWSVAFNADGSRLASADFDQKDRLQGETKLWDTATGTEILTLPGQFSVAFSSKDGRLASVLSGSILRPGKVVLFDGSPEPPGGANSRGTETK